MSDFKFTVGGDSVPSGQYTGRFARPEDYTENADSYGPGVKLVFAIVGGEYDGQETSRIVSRKTGKGSNLCRFASMLNGGPLEKGEDFDLDRYRGRPGIVLIEDTQGGATRVASFIPQGNGQATPQLVAQATPQAQAPAQAPSPPQASPQAQAPAQATPQAPVQYEPLPWEGQ